MYIVVYLTDNSDLYYEEFDWHKDALKFIEDTENKCILIQSESLMRVEDHT